MELLLTEEQAAAVRRAALNGEYQLLLGAGASLDTESPSGVTLPNSAQLAERLSREFSVPVEPGDLLWRIYARAVKRAGSVQVYSFLRSLFWNTRPPVWMDAFARFPWERVWTLNIDDSFEHAYQRCRVEGSRRLTTRSWNDEFVQDRTLSVIHLHGSVSSETPSDLIFSLPEYFNATVSRAAWPLAFRDEYGTRPFVVVGARLRDEPDIEAVVARRVPSHSAPSIYVSPNISDAMRADLEDWGLVPFEGTAELFISWWEGASGIDLSTPASTREEISLRVGRQFQELRLDRTPKSSAKHDFLGGDPPLWGDITGSKYAELDWIRQAIVLVKRWGTSAPLGTALIYAGHRLSGRTTGLLVLCRVLCNNAWRVFVFKADERPDVDAILRFAADGKAIALVFDGVADFAEDVDKLLDEARRARLSVVCLAVDSQARSAGIVGRISSEHLFGGSIKSINRILTRADAARLVDNLARHGRLGVLEPRPDGQRLQHFARRELFTALAEVENAPGFGVRVTELVGEVDDPAALRLCLFATAAERVERPLLVVDAAQMLGMESEKVLRLVRLPGASALLWSDGKRVFPRQRYMALRGIIDRFGTREAMSTLNAGLVALASRAGMAAHRERNATVMLVGALMTYRNLSDMFPGESLERWYDDMQPGFGSWSGRFWEQRAIMSRHLGAQVAGALARAESYAERAVSLVGDPYSYTTLGTVLCARGASVGPELVASYYDRAYDAFEAADRMDPTNIVTWFAYLRYALPILQSVGPSAMRGDGLFERISDDWQLIHDQLLPTASKSDATRRDLAYLRGRFEDIQTELLDQRPTDELASSEDLS